MLGRTILLTMFSYNHDVNNRLLDLAANVTPAQWDASHDYGHNSLHEIMFHILAVEDAWLHLCRHGKPIWDQILIADYPDVPSLRALSDRVYGEYRPYIDSLTEDQLAASVHATMPEGADRAEFVWHMLIHAFNHSTLHRSEVALILTQAGLSPGSIDFYGYHVITS